MKLFNHSSSSLLVGLWLPFCAVVLLLFFPLSSVNGQNRSITGMVVELTTGEPMQFANVALYQASDSVSIFKGTSTNKDGVFLFENIFTNNYFIRVSSIGFESNQTSIFHHDAATDVGEISIRPSDILLEDVIITGEKSLYVQEIDKRVYNVGQDILSESGSASEILQNIPSVTVDVNGQVTLRGTSNITFLINGRPSALLRRSSATALQQMPANTIERIEVITNPSAKSKPDGTGGIINIVLKEETGKGFNGQITANIGNEGRYNTSFTANYGTENLNIFANYGIRHSARTAIYSDERTYRDSLGNEVLNYYNEEGNGTNDAFSHIANLGLDYEINNYNSFEISGTYYHSNSLLKSLSNISLLSPENQPETAFTSNETNDEYESEGEASAAWEHVFKNNEDHSLVVEATFAAYDEEEDLTYIEEYSLPEVEQTTETNLIQKGGNQTEVKAEYVLPVGEDIEIEAGYVGEFIKEKISYT
jgi:outer membrane receptor protein involved in Fe transport